MAYCQHPFKRPPLDVRSASVRAQASDFDPTWPLCQHSGCDNGVNPRRIAAIGKCVCLVHGETKLEAIERLDRAFVPAGAKQGYTYVADAAKQVRGIYKGANQNG